MPLLQILVPIGIGIAVFLVAGLTAPLWMQLGVKLSKRWKNQVLAAAKELDDEQENN